MINIYFILFSYAEISPTTLLSPTVTSRKEETDAMAHLNNRLAAYVDKVRHFETENSRLQQQITSYQETSKVEVSFCFLASLP